MIRAYDAYVSAPIELEAGTFNAVKGFFTSRDFGEIAAESFAVIIIRQARADGYNPMAILDTLRGLDNLEISALVSEIVNFNRFKTSFLGYAREFNTATEINRNILA